VAGHDALRDRQAQAGALADLLGGEEGIENALQVLRGNAVPGVRNGDLDALAAIGEGQASGDVDVPPV
jgi:hypothetical protein